MASSTDFFQCLVCKSLFKDLFKVQKHVQLHSEEELEGAKSTVGDGGCGDNRRRRGMLPIQKVTITECFVPLVRNQIDPEFLKGYDEVIPVDKCEEMSRATAHDRNAMGLEQEYRRPTRKCRLRAAVKLKQIMDEFEVDLNDGQPKKGNKRGRPATSYDNDEEFSPAHEEKADEPMKGKPSMKKKIQNCKNSKREVSLPCDYCGDVFLTSVKVVEHILSDHPDETGKLLKCPLSCCSSLHLNSQYLRLHLVRHDTVDQKQKIHSPCFEDQTLLMKYNKAHYFRDPYFHCKFCLNFRGSSLKEIEKHQDDAHSLFNLKCPHCEKDFEKNMSAFVKHLRIDHQNQLGPNHITRKLFRCQLCPYSSDYKDTVTMHAIRCHNNDKVVSKNTTTDDNINSNGISKFKCPVCDKAFTIRENLRRHFNLHLENNPFVCKFPGCEKKFNSNYNLKRHSVLHDEIARSAASVSCSLCDQTFSRRKTLFNHMLRVHKQQDRGIESLNSTIRKAPLYKPRNPKYLTYSELKISNAKINTTKEHEVTNSKTEGSVEAESMPVVHKVVKGELVELLYTPNETEGTEEGPIVLKETESLENDPAFKKMLAVDPKYGEFIIKKYSSSKTTFTCKDCSMNFSRAWSLQLHLQSFHKKNIVEEKLNIASSGDGGESTITLLCGICAYPAKDNQDLTRHMSTHDKQQWTCTHEGCFQGFYSHVKLSEHIRKFHPGSSSLTCKYCDETFFETTIKLRHIKAKHRYLWENEKNTRYTCKNCKEVFSSKHAYVRHMKKEHGESPDDIKPKCMLCNDTFANSQSLRRHIDCVHLGKPYNKLRDKYIKGNPNKKGKISNNALRKYVDSLLFGNNAGGVNSTDHSNQQLESNSDAAFNKDQCHNIDKESMPPSNQDEGESSIINQEEVVSILGF